MSSSAATRWSEKCRSERETLLFSVIGHYFRICEARPLRPHLGSLEKQVLEHPKTGDQHDKNWRHHCR